ncbi:hypothetical protein HYFRA_00005700 [Hymenoscyphus fraxineus]|uniref:Uncharacterized protein n=1 Tax=Hymenoscyphus fraxineus TaxID=746836 RepID=A0A9N9KR31_9HELO|nr:hypothetical protein HYFRA_00005700 [Hymenoscyphus fraxineus]
MCSPIRAISTKFRNRTSAPSSFKSSTATRNMSSSTGVPSTTAPAPKIDVKASEAGDLGIENMQFNTASGVELSRGQQVIVGSVLDLFAGRPSLKKLQLWTDDATFADPITKAVGRKQYEPQWYGLQTAFSKIERLSQNVTSAGNPITMDLKTRYTIKGIGKEQTIESVVNIYTDAAGEKIVKVEDKWNGELPEGPFAKAFRNLNAVTVPLIVSVPKNDAEDAKRGN